ncbi:MAG: hypothetical protein GY910_01615 [bacterium]|nr:hypothetical protein [bacterium]
MLRLFLATTILLTCADHWTTYLCLYAPIDGWAVSEANPIADWLFTRAGLGIGLTIDSLVTLGAIAFLTTTQIFDRSIKLALLAIICVATGYAVFNNLSAIDRMGLAPWSGLV